MISGKTKQQHVRVLPKEPIMSEFVAPPTQLPIDFYSPTWFNALPPGQKEKIANSKCVALLLNAAKSLLPVPHPSEQLSTSQFNKKYYEQLIRPYELIVAVESDDETLEQRGDVNVRADVLDEEGEGIDLTMPSDGEDADDNEYYAEGEFGELYDDANSKWLVSDSEESGTGENNYYGGREEKFEASDEVDKDGDQLMDKRGKAKE
ncbi:hypothetical protein CROQUDRAFT_86996 [Cronartium quercuum f. sp. fusiforme G11]|uniref:Uncharacterized protein n=1 Tax=Cronartium quercuum f. sp. fusiforme G11 TaxID=708437 RepID=A0A9P6NVL0_9BASI|nr:hypothetical protein CROQUDRAFT_86996 [Cronartium quercuum f. sp. fusiforme G11]